MGSARDRCCNIMARSLTAAIMIYTADSTGMTTCVGNNISVSDMIYILVSHTHIIYHLWWCIPCPR